MCDGGRVGLDRCDGLAGRGPLPARPFDGAQGERPRTGEGRHETCPYRGSVPDCSGMVEGGGVPAVLFVIHAAADYVYAVVLAVVH